MTEFIVLSLLTLFILDVHSENELFKEGKEELQKKKRRRRRSSICLSDLKTPDSSVNNKKR